MFQPATSIVAVTIRVDGGLDAGPELVFDAYADVDQRVRWSAPADEIVLFESHGFGPGDGDRFLRGPQENPDILGTIRYEHIVPNECIVFTQRLTGADNQLLAVSLISWLIAPSSAGSELSIVDQTTSVCGSRPIEGARYGYKLMLDRLAHHLAGRR